MSELVDISHQKPTSYQRLSAELRKRSTNGTWWCTWKIVSLSIISKLLTFIKFSVNAVVIVLTAVDKNQSDNGSGEDKSYATTWLAVITSLLILLQALLNLENKITNYSNDRKQYSMISTNLIILDGSNISEEEKISKVAAMLSQCDNLFDDLITQYNLDGKSN